MPTNHSKTIPNLKLLKYIRKFTIISEQGFLGVLYSRSQFRYSYGRGEYVVITKRINTSTLLLFQFKQLNNKDKQ